MGKIYIDYENADILEYPVDEEYEEFILVDELIIPEEFVEGTKGKFKLDEFQTKKKGGKHIWMYVGNGEKNVPHIHILREKYDGKDTRPWDTSSPLHLLKNVCFIHTDKQKSFKDKDEFKLIVEHLKSVYTGKYPCREGITVWEQGCRKWNEINYNYEIPEGLIDKGMPKYDFKTIVNYREV